MNRALILIPLFVLVAACGPRSLEPDTAHVCDRCDDWNKPIEPFRVHGNTWYVGTNGLSSILIETDAGLILIDGALSQSAALIDANIRALGFDPHEIKAILVSHPHFDHAGGVAALQHMTRATAYASEAGIEPLSTGKLTRDDPQFVAGSDASSFPPISNLTVVGDGDVVTVGTTNVRAVYTPGHTNGSVSWTWESCAMNTCYNIVYADSMTAVSAPGYSFAASGEATRMIESAGKIADLECDILLSPHPFFFGMHAKLERRDEGNPFIGELACVFYAETALDWLQQRLDAEGR